MNLLVINFQTDELHGVLAWQAKVVKELSKQCKKLIVVTSKVGKFAPPPNVITFQVPKRPLGVPQRFGGRWGLNWHVYQLCKIHKIDAVFIHMAMEWCYRLFPVFRCLGLPVIIWYAHGTVTWRLKLAVRCADRVLTSTPEGCNISSKKVQVIGQGVDTDLFQIPLDREPQYILYIGRISQRKRIDLLLNTQAEILRRNRLKTPHLKVVGPVLTPEDIQYDWKIRRLIWERGLQNTVDCVGYIPIDYLPQFYTRAFLHLSLSKTNSMDKTVVEALSAGCPVLTSNPAFWDLLKGYPEFFIKDERPGAIAEKVEHVFDNWNIYDPVKLRGLVEGRHDLRSYANRVLRQIQECILD